MFDLDYLGSIPDRAEEDDSAPPARPIAADPAEDAFEEGAELLLAGHYREALAAFRKATGLAPQFFRAHTATVDALLALDEFDQAEDLSDRLLERYNRNTDLGSACARVLLHRAADTGDAEQTAALAMRAAQFCDIATQGDRGSRYAWLCKGETVLARRRGPFLEAARQCFARAMAGERDWRMAVRVAMVYCAWGWPGEAERRLRRALTWAPDRPVIHYRLGLALLGRGRVADARAAFTEAARLGGDGEPVRAGLAACRLGARVWRRARKLAAALWGIAAAVGAFARKAFEQG